MNDQMQEKVQKSFQGHGTVNKPVHRAKTHLAFWLTLIFKCFEGKDNKISEK